MRQGTTKTTDDVLAELIGDVEIIAAYLAHLQDSQMPGYDETRVRFAGEIEIMVRLAVETARAARAMVEREQSGASLQ